MNITTMILFGRMPKLPTGPVHLHTCSNNADQIKHHDKNNTCRGNRQRNEIIDLLQEGPSSLTMIADYVGISLSSTKRHLSVMIDAGKIVRIDPKVISNRNPVTYQIAREGDA